MAVELRGPAFSVHKYVKDTDTVVYKVEANDGTTISKDYYSIKTAFAKCWELNCKAAKD